MIKSAKSFLDQVHIARLIVIVLLPCISCNEGDRSDKVILDHGQMVKILTEIYLTEQKINRLGVSRDSGEHEFERFKKVVFQRVGVSDSVFKRSFDYYMDRPKEMEMIYTMLVDSLSLMEQRSDSIRKK